MTDRDLSALLERATEDVVELDFAQNAWNAALADRRNRRRRLLAGVGAVAAAALAVTAVQLGGSTDPHPEPAVTSPVTTPATTGTLADRTAYAVMPLEGKEDALGQFDVGLPSDIDPWAKATTLSARLRSGALPAVLAVYLRPVGEDYQPVLVVATGESIAVDGLRLVATRDSGGNAGSPLGARAVAGGADIVFPQPGKVVRLEARTGKVTSYPVPSQAVESAGWTRSGRTSVVRSQDRAWTVDPQGGAVTVADPGSDDGRFQLGATADTRSLGIRWFAADGSPEGQRSIGSPVTELWGDTVGTATWAASGAFYDQNLTSPLIRRGNGPIYQGLVAVEAKSGPATILVAPESPDGLTGRIKGCCSVLGWADDDTVVFQTFGSHDSWLLAWNVRTGVVYKVTRIRVDAAKQALPRFALAIRWTS
jgi:hypothetical protein